MNENIHLVTYVLLDIAVIMIAARLMGSLFRRMRQPAVVGEILAGILLGPTLLGALPGELDLQLFPLEVRPTLGVIAQIGLVLFMFIVGLEVDFSLIRGRARLAGVVSITSVIVPLSLGIILGQTLYERHKVVDGEVVPALGLSLFIGVAMSITAFPVLARILTERGMHRIPLGAISLACAAVDDILAWSLLAIVVAIVNGGTVWGVAVILAGTAAFAALVLLVVRPAAQVLVRRYHEAGRVTPELLAVVLIGVLLSAYATDRIGVHAIFGAFLFGVAMPRREATQFRKEVIDQLEQVSVLLLLPVFFITTGLSADVGQLGTDSLGELALIIAVACSAKFLGAAGAARLQGLGGRASTALGILLNTRGLTELVILQVGRQLGVLDQDLFTMLLIMAIVTTVITEPLLRIVYPDRLLAREIAAAERAQLGIPNAYRVLVVLDGRPTDESTMALAVDLTHGRAPAEIVLSRLVRMPAGARPGFGGALVGELGEMAEAIEQVSRLASSVDPAHASAVPLARFSTTPDDDLVQQIESLEVNLVLVREDVLVSIGSADVVNRLRTEVPCAVTVLSGSELSFAVGKHVAVAARGDRDGLLAVSLAGRIATRHNLPLRLDGQTAGRGESRKLAAELAKMRQSGVIVADEAGPQAPGDAALVVLGLSGSPREDLSRAASWAPELVVRAGEDDDDAKPTM